MEKFFLSATMVGVLALCQPAFADEIADLKAELAAQKAAAAAQQARMDALEARLNGVQSQQATAQAQPAGVDASGKPLGVSFAQGEGLTYRSPTGSLSLYGLIDATLSHSNHANDEGGRLTGYRVAWFSGNRWGLTGRRALGSTGLETIFKLESEFENNTGNMDTPGVLFNRDAWVGVQSEGLGKLTFGRQNALGRDISGIYGDPYGSAKAGLEEGGYTNNNNFKALIFYAGSATGTRLDNGVVWKKVFDNGLVGGVAYQFGNVPGSFAKGTTETASLAYNGGKFNVAGFVTHANVAGLSNNTASFGGNYQLGDVRLNAGYYHYTADQGALGKRTDNAYTVSAKYAPSGPWDYELGYQVMKAKNAAVNASGNVLNAYADATGATSTATGSRATLYTSVFYHFDKITEVYFAADYMKLRNGYRVGSTNGFNNQTEFGIGLRTRF